MTVPYGSESGRHDYAYGYEKGRSDGWNACRDSMLERIGAPQDIYAEELARFRAALQLIASQGPNFGPDGTLHTWEHWSVIARKALEWNRMELNNEQ